MNPENIHPRVNKPTGLQLIAWVLWAGFFLLCLGAFGFAEAEKRDAYFIRHYQNVAMDAVTIIVTRYPVWMAVLPLLLLPLVIAYQRNPKPGVWPLLLLFVMMFAMTLGIAFLLVCSGPPIQM